MTGVLFSSPSSAWLRLAILLLCVGPSVPRIVKVLSSMSVTKVRPLTHPQVCKASGVQRSTERVQCPRNIRTGSGEGPHEQATTGIVESTPHRIATIGMVSAAIPLVKCRA